MASSMAKPTFDSFSDSTDVLGVVIPTACLVKTKAFAQATVWSWVGVFGSFSTLRSASQEGDADCIEGGRVGGKDGGNNHMHGDDTGDCR